MLDEYGEELYADLKIHFQLDLAEFIAGGVASTPRLILSLIRRLPEGSHYAAALAALPKPAATATETPAEIDPVAEARTWTHDKELLAQLINSVNVLVTHSIPWEQGKAPKLPLVGPAAWRGEGPKGTAEPLSVMGVFNKIAGNNGR